MFISKHVLMGVLGDLIGFLVGVLAAGYFGSTLEGIQLRLLNPHALQPSLLALSVGGATVLAVLAGWIPTIIATQQDPAEILREE